MSKATEKMIAFATKIAERLGIEDELEAIIEDGAEFNAVSEFIDEYKDEKR